MKSEYECVIVGGGPAGLAAAIALKKLGIDDLIVLERNARLGGILNQCIHPGFGLERFGSDFTGPEYAKALVREFREAGAECATGAMVLEISDSRRVRALSHDDGYSEIRASAVVVATGCRERTRENLEIAGTRPAGVFTAGQAQNLINLGGFRLGERVVIQGSGDIGLIMARRLKIEGYRVEGVLERLPYLSGLIRNKVQCLDHFGIPLRLCTQIREIVGKDRVEGVWIERVDEKQRPMAGTREWLPCDTVLFSVGLIPEVDILKSAGFAPPPGRSVGVNWRFEAVGGKALDGALERALDGALDKALDGTGCGGDRCARLSGGSGGGRESGAVGGAALDRAGCGGDGCARLDGESGGGRAGGAVGGAALDGALDGALGCAGKLAGQAGAGVGRARDRSTGIFICGNALHIHDLADNASREGEIVAGHVARFLRGRGESGAGRGTVGAIQGSGIGSSRGTVGAVKGSGPGGGREAVGAIQGGGIGSSREAVGAVKGGGISEEGDGDEAAAGIVAETAKSAVDVADAVSGVGDEAAIAGEDGVCADGGGECLPYKPVRVDTRFDEAWFGRLAGSGARVCIVCPRGCVVSESEAGCPRGRAYFEESKRGSFQPLTTTVASHREGKRARLPVKSIEPVEVGEIRLLKQGLSDAGGATDLSDEGGETRLSVKIGDREIQFSSCP